MRRRTRPGPGRGAVGAVALALVVGVLALGGPAGAAAGATTATTATTVASTSDSAAAGTRWLCRPGLGSDDCRGDLTTTIQRSDGSSRVVYPRTDEHAPVDCFYVYPTSSQQPTPNARARREASVRAVARQQVQRFSSVCRVFAPLYRQRTLVALAAESTTTTAQKARYNRTAYVDVRRAWRDYLRRAAPDRGVVLVGHSQGSRLLRRLVREEIDPRPRVRERLVSAILPGANVLVRAGREVGGDFRHVPVCRRGRQVGCVLAWSTFGERPPSDSRFGRPSGPATDAGLGLPTGRRYDVVCTNPASLAADRRRPTHAIARSEPFPGLLGVLLLGVYRGLPPRADTPFVVPAERYTARCESPRGLRVLRLRPIDGARTLQPQPDDTWGLHLVDVNIVLGDLLRLVRLQSAAFLRAQA